MNKAASSITEAPSLSLVASPLDNMLNALQSHGLTEQNRAALMTRVDDKFVIHSRYLQTVLKHTENHYSVLEQGSNRIFDYETTYYDTPDYLFYSQHHSGILNRMKVRIRKYVQAKLCFLEIKQKSNKGVTHKHRHEILESSGSLITEDSQLEKATQQALIPALQVNYQRITLLHKTLNQRITLDLNLRYSNLRGEQDCDLSDLVIIEIKRDRKDHFLQRSEFHHFLKDLGYLPTNFSKYCMGCLFTDVQNIKFNRFKSNYLAINKLLEE